MKQLNFTDILPSWLNSKAKTWQEGLIFVLSMWLLSRLVIVIAIQIVAPLLPLTPVADNGSEQDFFVPKMGWELFSHWDGKWYQKIATRGYEYVNDGKMYSVAFFPLFPLLARGIMTLGLPFTVAATLVNNFALLGALFLLYSWTEEYCGINAAKWATAVLAFCPFSLYGSVIYTEGLFLLVTTAALRAFEKHRYGWAALLGTMVTASRAPGIAIVPAFILVAWKEKRPRIAYITAIAASAGLLLFILYCAIRFGDPLAFVNVQKAWRVWQPELWDIFVGFFTQIRENTMRILMVFGGGYLLWDFRAKLPSLAVVYGFCSLGVILATGSLLSLNRYAYGIVSLSMALGLLISKHPRWGYVTLGFFIILLMQYSILFAWGHWVG